MPIGCRVLPNLNHNYNSNSVYKADAHLVFITHQNKIEEKSYKSKDANRNFLIIKDFSFLREQLKEVEDLKRA